MPITSTEPRLSLSPLAYPKQANPSRQDPGLLSIMKAQLAVLPLMAASLPQASAQLHRWAKKAGLKYFGSATDTPGQRERAGYEDVYPLYDAILADKNMFGQTTPTNGQKVRLIPSPPNHMSPARITDVP